MRLCVVALNPAIDVEWRVDEILWEEKNIVHTRRRWPGGKGVNVARWLKFLGADAGLLIPLGGANGREMSRGLRAQGVRFQAIPLAQETRANVVVTAADGRQMRFNPLGPNIGAGEWREILATAKQALQRGASLLLSGALPGGVPPDGYARLIRLAHRFGRRAFLDCDGAALVAAVEAKPFLTKPNLHELSRWAGRELGNDAEMIRAARRMSAQSNGWVLVSLGAKGALLVNARERFMGRAAADKVAVLNTIGAGDALLAAAVKSVEKGLRPELWLREGVIAGTAATQCPAGQLPSRRLLEKIARGIRMKALPA